MSTPRYSYTAINTLALSDTGHFIYLSTWSINVLLSMLSQERSLYLWANDQNPLTESEIDDLDNKISIAQGEMMTPLVGLIMPICTEDIPEGTLLCDGASYLRADYPNLYDALDTVFIVDGDNFLVPDLRDRFVIGVSPTKTIGTNGGSFEHTQIEAELAPHSHTSSPHSHSESVAAPTAITIGAGVPAPSALPAIGITGATAVSIDSTGGGSPMDITPPYIALRYVVVAL